MACNKPAAPSTPRKGPSAPRSFAFSPKTRQLAELASDGMRSKNVVSKESSVPRREAAHLQDAAASVPAMVEAKPSAPAPPQRTDGHVPMIPAQPSEARNDGRCRQRVLSLRKEVRNLAPRMGIVDFSDKICSSTDSSRELQTDASRPTREKLPDLPRKKLSQVVQQCVESLELENNGKKLSKGTAGRWKQ